MAKLNMYLTLLLSAVLWNAVTAEDCSVEDAKAKVLEPIWLEGPAAPLVDDGISRIQCPEGYYVRKCHVNKGSGDGSKISDTRTCLAQNSRDKVANLKAVVLCQLQSLDIEVTSHSVNVPNQNEAVSCPPGYVMDSCVGLHYWSHEGTYEVNYGVNQCSWSSKTSGTGAKPMALSYICLKAVAV